MSTTTLITFRIRAPLATRTLRLYGSWDNFQQGYAMAKDLQAGSEYWSGCFNFANIICDGRPGDLTQPRDGGLRMGGTYWYYYKINDETDFHNVCERATTNCPMLPGQLINVLNIPFALSGNRSRNPSTSSTSSERRTMNPADRFMNPRPAPAKPMTARASTSPVQETFTSRKDGAVEKRDLGVRTHIQRKISLDAHGGASGGIAGGLRAAFRMRSARSQSPEAKDNDEKNHRRAMSSDRSGNGSVQAQRVLSLRSTSEHSVAKLGFEAHRRQRSQTRELSSIRHAPSAESLRQVEPLILLTTNHQPLKTLKEVASSSSTPVDDNATELQLKAEADLEKRLPTLPTTPSSAYPPSVVAASPERGLDLDALNSHFSATTIDTECNPLSSFFTDHGHFSAWTTRTQSSLAEIDTTLPVPIPFDDGQTPINQNRTLGLDTCLPSSVSLTSVSSSISTTPSTSFLDIDTEIESVDVNGFRRRSQQQTFQHYCLPVDDYTSAVTLKAPVEERRRGRSPGPAGVYRDETGQVSLQGQDLVHSESMRKLLEELSYLSDMIQR